MSSQNTHVWRIEKYSRSDSASASQWSFIALKPMQIVVQEESAIAGARFKVVLLEPHSILVH